MTRRRKIWTWVGASLMALVLLIVIVGIGVVRTAWFANYVSRKIVSITEEATGGRAELGSFAFDWTHLHARVTNFVLHGTEPSGSLPLLQIAAIDLRLKLLPSLKKTVDLQYLGVDTPSANIIVFPNGTTNVPQPKVPSKSNKSALETIVDLAIAQFDLNHGSIQFAQQIIPLAAHGRDLRAQLTFNTVASIYRGELSFSSIQLLRPGHFPIEATVNVPVTIGKDRIEVDTATVRTAASFLTLTGSLSNLQHPVVNAHLITHISLQEVQRAAGTAMGACVNGRPCFADADVAAHIDEQKFELTKAALTLGRSRLNASGDRASVYLEGKLAMDELGAIFQFAGDSVGDIQLEGRVKSEADRIDIQALRVDALGGNITIDGSLANYDVFQFRGRLGGFQLADLEHRFLGTKQGYGGSLAGLIDASGELARPGTSGINARAQLDIIPAPQGIPLKGRIDANFQGAKNQIGIALATLTLPHSQLSLNGTLGTRMNADFTSTDLNDLSPALAMSMKNPPRELPMALHGGKVDLHAHADGPLTSPAISAHLTAAHLAVEQRAFDLLNADLTVSPKGFALQNGTLSRGTLQATFSASAGLRNWVLTNDQPLQANANLQNAELPDLFALAGEGTIPATGKLTATVDVSGTVGNPQGMISASAAAGSLYGEAFQTLRLQANLSDQLIRLTNADWIGPAGTVQVTGTYTHPRDTLLAGDLRVHAASNQVKLSAVSNVTKQHAGLDGTLQLNLDAAANITQNKGQTEVALTSLSGDARGDNIHDSSRNFGRLSAHASTRGSTVSFRADSNLSGSSIHATGETTLAKDYPTTADLSVENLVIENLPFDLGVAIKGTVGITSHAQGTLQNPAATAQLNLAKGSIQGEPIDKLQASARYTPQLITLSSMEVTAPAGTATLNGSFTHPANDFTSGAIQLHLASGDLRIDRIHTLQGIRPGFGGALKLSADVAADMKTVKGDIEVLPSQLNASAALTGLTYSGHPAGSAQLIAKTSGSAVNFSLDSDIAQSKIHAQGEAKLTAGYPVNAQFSARDLRFSSLKPFFNIESATDFDAVTEVEGSVSGSLKNLDQLRAGVKIPSFEATARPRGAGTKSALAIRNDGPLEATLDHSIVTIRSAHLLGPKGTDIVLTGTLGVTDKYPLDLTVKANAELGLLQDIDRDFYSSGAVTLNAIVRGSLSDPITNGSLQLKNASMNMVGFSNGISNANGTIALNGSTATVRNLTGESGGGKITLSGFAALTGGSLRYSLRANATHVRTREQGVSIVNDASITASGTTRQGVISGTVTIISVGINPQSDLGAILTTTAAARVTDDDASPLLANTRLDIRIQTAPNVRFQSALAQDLQAEANLNLVGTLSNPGMTGRVLVTEGSLIFFGNEYTVNRGVINFYNTLRIEPQLNVSLETNVKSVDVVLTLTGPMDNLKLSYRSDPPLQFDEIVGLLATGRRPSSDPTIVANEAPPPQQSVGQMGESAIVSQAIASPVSSRLARVFGVTQLSIDPTFASGSALPQASLSLQQRVANNVTFTYTQDYSQSNSELVRVEWTLSPRFSAVATRDINGIFGVDFFYKRQFH